MNANFAWKYVLLVLTAGITCMLFYLSVSIVYLVEINVTQQYSDERKIQVDNGMDLKFYQDKDRLMCVMTGFVKDPLIQGLMLRVSSSYSMKPDSVKIPITAAFFEIPVQLSASGTPVSPKTVCNYELFSDHGTLLSQGVINVEVKDQLSASKPWIINVTTAVGFLASLLQIIELLKIKSRRRQPQA